MARVTRTWHGEQIRRRAKRAAGRGLIAFAENVAADGKRNAHVISGTMRRSIHTAKVGYDGADDEDRARTQDLPNAKVPTPVAVGWGIEVGSWLPYACVEEVGRGHQFMTPAFESNRGAKAALIFVAAFKQEGLA